MEHTNPQMLPTSTNTDRMCAKRYRSQISQDWDLKHRHRWTQVHMFTCQGRVSGTGDTQLVALLV